MSKVKYPDKEKIRIQIDEILDKSELFDATEDKSSTYTNDKIVQLKPVKQHLPVGKYIGAVAAIAEPPQIEEPTPIKVASFVSKSKNLWKR